MAHNKAVDDIEKIIVYGYCTDICVISKRHGAARCVPGS